MARRIANGIIGLALGATLLAGCGGSGKSADVKIIRANGQQF